MTAAELLYEVQTLSADFLELAMETDGVKSGLAAECSQRLRDLHDEFDQRFTNNGAKD